LEVQDLGERRYRASEVTEVCRENEGVGLFGQMTELFHILFGDAEIHGFLASGGLDGFGYGLDAFGGGSR
jgi:hypothetical protein